MSKEAENKNQTVVRVVGEIDNLNRAVFHRIVKRTTIKKLTHLIWKGSNYNLDSWDAEKIAKILLRLKYCIDTKEKKIETR